MSIRAIAGVAIGVGRESYRKAATHREEGPVMASIAREIAKA